MTRSMLRYFRTCAWVWPLVLTLLIGCTDEESSAAVPELASIWGWHSGPDPTVMDFYGVAAFSLCCPEPDGGSEGPLEIGTLAVETHYGGCKLLIEEVTGPFEFELYPGNDPSGDAPEHYYVRSGEGQSVAPDAPPVALNLEATGAKVHLLVISATTCDFESATFRLKILGPWYGQNPPLEDPRSSIPTEMAKRFTVWIDEDCSEPPPPPTTTGIVFATYRDGDFEIFTMDPDGTRVIQRTRDGNVNVDPVWSPDGTQIAFLSDRDSTSQEALDLYVLDLTDNVVRRLTYFTDTGGGVLDPAWSPVPDPSGQAKIAFAGDDGEGWVGIFLVDEVTAPPTIVQLSTGPEDRLPTWSPDGDSIAFCNEQGLLRVDVQTDYTLPPLTPVVLLDRGNYDRAPAWSPLGDALAFAAQGPNENGIQLFDLDTQQVTPLTSTPDDRMPAWSPDGNHILFVRDGDGPRIWKMTATGAEAAEIPDQVMGNNNPDWK